MWALETSGIFFHNQKRKRKDVTCQLLAYYQEWSRFSIENISNATKACDNLVRDQESRKNQFQKLQDLWHDQQDLSYYSQVFVSHTDLLEKLFLGGNSGHCRKLLQFFFFWVIWINFYIFTIMLGYSVKQLILVTHLITINNNKNNIYTVNKHMLNFGVKLKTTYFIPVGLVLLIIIF